MASHTAYGQEYLFHVKVNAEGINIRTDSTPSADIICKANKGDLLNVLAEAYDWYKINLPKNAHVFVKKELVSLNEDNKSAKITRDNVNIRLRPDLGAPIVGRLKQDTTVMVIEGIEGWYKIEPPENSFGWIYKRFADKIEYAIQEAPKTEEIIAPAEIPEDKIPQVEDNAITITGVLKPKTFIGIATHKMLDGNKKLYLLKSPTVSLNPFNHHKVKVNGIPDGQLSNAKYTVISVDNIEVID